MHTLFIKISSCIFTTSIVVQIKIVEKQVKVCLRAHLDDYDNQTILYTAILQNIFWWDHETNLYAITKTYLQ